MEQCIRFGFIGTGSITTNVMKDFHKVKGAAIGAVFSRQLKNARFFAEQHGINYYYDTIEQMIEDRKFDIAYVALINTKHKEYALKLLHAGIPVLCEKPMTMNAADTKTLIDAARNHQVFLMEGFWTAFFKVVNDIKLAIEKGELGKIVLMQGNFLFNFVPPNYATSRLFAPDLGGGAYLDIGCYLNNFSNFILGAYPTEVATFSQKHPMCNVDSTNVALMKYDTGTLAALHMSMNVDGCDTFTIYGEKGRIEIDEHFWKPKRATLILQDGTRREFLDKTIGDGYEFEFAHVMECVAAGLTESPILPLDFSFRSAEILDKMIALS
ncbi:MAG: Gfo/Idh/MocA family protein [Lachnospiraceae bacterium]